MASTTNYLKVDRVQRLLTAGFLLLLGGLSAGSYAAQMPSVIQDGFKESAYRDREVPQSQLQQPGKSGDARRDGRARMLQKKCLAMVNKKTPQRHVYQPGSLLYGMGAHPGIFMVYLETAAHYRGVVGEQWSACGFNSINNLSYLRVHRDVLISRPQ